MSQADRDLVLSFPDLAEQLTKRPLSFPEPGAWNGYVPPDTFNGQHNNSPRREALLAIIAEAHRRVTAQYRQVAQ